MRPVFRFHAAVPAAIVACALAIPGISVAKPGADGTAARPTAETPAALTALERAKLDLARAAVEASRRAGTLFAPPREEPRAAFVSPDPARKLARLRSQLPAPLRADAAAGLAPEFQPIQRVGPAGLNAVEQAKRNGGPLPAPPPAATWMEDLHATGDGAPSPSAPRDSKEPRHD